MLKRNGSFFCITFLVLASPFTLDKNKIKQLKRSLNYICGNECFKYVIDGKLYMKFSVKAQEKNCN